MMTQCSVEIARALRRHWPTMFRRMSNSDFGAVLSLAIVTRGG
jgi:hypothetical protein